MGKNNNIKDIIKIMSEYEINGFLKLIKGNYKSLNILVFGYDINNLKIMNSAKKYNQYLYPKFNLSWNKNNTFLSKNYSRFSFSYDNDLSKIKIFHLTKLKVKTLFYIFFNI